MAENSCTHNSFKIYKVMRKSPQDLAPAGQETSKCNMHEHTRAQSTPLPRSYSRMCSQTTTHMNITTQWAVRCVLSATLVAPSSAPTCEKALVKQRWERRRAHNLGVLQPQNMKPQRQKHIVLTTSIGISRYGPARRSHRQTSAETHTS